MVPRTGDVAKIRRRRFSHNIYRIKQEELGVLVEKLDAKCPDAIDKSTSDDEIEINIDAIDPRTFHDLDRYARRADSFSDASRRRRGRGSSFDARGDAAVATRIVLC